MAQLMFKDTPGKNGTVVVTLSYHMFGTDDGSTVPALIAHMRDMYIHGFTKEQIDRVKSSILLSVKARG